MKIRKTIVLFNMTMVGFAFWSMGELLAEVPEDADKKTPNLWDIPIFRESLSLVPIIFYGKVVDENAKPVPDATAIFSVNDDSADGATRYERKTNADGLFTLDGVKGGGTLVRAIKEGYYSLQKGGLYFYYNRIGEKHIPDVKNPIIFKLRKIGDPVNLVKKKVRVRVPRDGAPITIHLLTGNPSPNGELELRAWKPQLEDTRKGRFDWKTIISITNGGIKEHHEEFPFLAPEDGYDQVLEINMPANLGDDWKNSVQKHLYFTFGKPRIYGRATFRSDGNKITMICDYYLNPTGSRNLEMKDGEGL